MERNGGKSKPREFQPRALFLLFTRLINARRGSTPSYKESSTNSYSWKMCWALKKKRVSPSIIAKVGSDVTRTLLLLPWRQWGGYISLLSKMRVWEFLGYREAGRFRSDRQTRRSLSPTVPSSLSQPALLTLPSSPENKGEWKKNEQEEERRKRNEASSSNTAEADR